MEFGDWEVDNSVWEESAEDGEVQESVQMRRDRLLASAEDTDTHPHTEGGDEVGG